MKKNESLKIPDQLHRTKRALYCILIFHMFCFALEAPHFTDIVIQLGGSLRMASIIISFRAVLSFLFTPILSSKSDEVGRKAILLLGIVGQTVAFLISYLSNSVSLIFLARTILGVTLTIPSVGQAYLIDLSRPEDVPKQLSTMGASLGIGFLLGVSCGGVVASQLGNRIPSLIAVVIGVGMFLLAFFDLPDSSKPASASASASQPKAKKGLLETLNNLRTLLSEPTVGNILKTRGMIELSNGILGFSIVEYSKSSLGLAPQGRGFLLMYYGVVISILQMNVTKIAEWMGGSERFVKVAFYGTIVSTICIPLIPNFWIFLIVSTISMALSYAASPIIMAQASAALPSSKQGSLMGMGESLVSFGQTIGPLWCGFSIPIHITIPFFSSALSIFAANFLFSQGTQKDIKKGK